MPKCADLRAVGEFVASRHGVLTLRQASDFDLSRNDIARLVRDGVAVRVRHGVVRFAMHPDTWRQQLYIATVDVRAVASYRSAAALHGLDGYSDPPDVPEISCHHFAPVRVPGAVVRSSRALPNADVVVVDGIRSTTLARTVCDLAGTVDTDTLVRMIDDIQRRGVSLDWLLRRAELLLRPGRSGPREVIDIVERRLHGYRVPDSWFERLLQRCLDSRALDGLVRQHVLVDEAGSFVARFDLALPHIRLGVEGHSRSFHVGERNERYDEDRDIRAAQQGWEVVYLGFAATRSPAAVCRDIELVAARRMRDLGGDIPTLAASALERPA